MFVELCRQQDRCGCGVACLAMLTYRSYREALALVRQFKGRDYDPNTSVEAHRALRSLDTQLAAALVASSSVSETTQGKDTK